MTITEARNSEAPGTETPAAATTVLIGYARVSTSGQDLAAQLDVLAAAGVPSETTYSDKLSGRAGSARPGLAECLRYARRGDVLVVAAIDRLGRSVAEVTATIADLARRGVLVRALREGVDTGPPTGRAVASIMASLAELEADLGRERRSASREARVSRGLPATRPPKLTVDQEARLVRLYAGGEPADELASMFGVSKRTVFRVIARQRQVG